MILDILIGGEQKNQSIKTDGICTCLCTAMDTGGGYIPMVVEMEIELIGQMEANYESSNRVYKTDGLSPTINTMGGGNRQPKIIVAMRGRNPENPKSRVAGFPTEQRLEPRFDGCSNTLTTVTKDNLVLESNGFYEQAINTAVKGNAEPGDIIDAFNERVIKSGIAPTVTTRPEGKKTAILPVDEQYRIRKLTPLECFRLMDVTDEDAKKMLEVNSNTQCYKQAGNSIVVGVMAAMFRKLF